MRAWLWRAALLALLMLGSPLIWAASVELSEEQLQWIALHPVLRVGVVEGLIPFEYMSDGVLRGRSMQYLQFVTAATGLRFNYVPGNTLTARENMLLTGEVDLLSSYLRFRSEPATKGLVALVYHTTSPIIVTRVDSPGIFDLEQLQGKNVMIPDVDYYETMFQGKATKAHLTRSTSAMQMLTRVKEGKADAVVASETFLMPYLYRQFQGVLEISGVVGSEMLDVSMAVRADDVILRSIFERVLDSITAQQRNSIYESWYHDLDVDAPSLLNIFNHFAHVLILGVLALASLCALVYRGYRLRGRALRNEQEKSMFLAVMNHQIRSPMNAVLAAMELLGHTRLNQQQRHFAQLANSGADAMARLLDDILETSGSVPKPKRLKVEPTDVTALVQAVVGLHRLRAMEKHLDMKPHIQVPLPLLMLDSARLTQIFHNLLSNAIKFTDAGSIDIDVRQVDLGVSTEHLQIEVRDTGIGISAAVQASLFRPYAQHSQSYKRSGGSGLGLVICRQLVSLMNGTLTLKSVPGAGTTVTICLPVAAAPQPPASPPAEVPLPSKAGSALQILVVEDTRANQEVLRAQISSFGGMPVVAGDAAQARTLFTRTLYHVVLMDCDLPDQDGYSLTRELRAFEQQQGRLRCPIIAISALTGEEHLQRCLTAGMDAVLSKPIRLGPLREAIERWCEVTLADPRSNLTAPVLDQAGINREVAADLGSLTKAIALCDRSDALHVTHRLHGAALIMEWSAMGQAAEALENLLRAQQGWDDPACAQALRVLLRQWHELGGEGHVDALPITRPHRIQP
ncbi:ATP-binding protein [Pseudomonas sp. KBS0710]|uniref:hybrid sensor histidine kinase/response regulator n=1 Tax=Pseudomonas sp. KBS0710 TaxID=1179667 RepID=UPI002115BAED|nr:ATP-binding protein [Pseudomonas sp. KBS0710]